MFFDPTKDEAAQLARALGAYEGVLKMNGKRLEAGLMKLKVHLVARSSQEPPPCDAESSSGDDDVMLPILIETRTVAEALSLSQRAVSRLIANGSLPSVKVGGARRIHRDDLVAFAQSLRKERDGPLSQTGSTI